MRYLSKQKRDLTGHYFTLPNEIFSLGLSAGELAVYTFLLYCENRKTYDRCECTAKNQVYPDLGDRFVGDITAADIKKLLTDEMNSGYAYTTVKKTYRLHEDARG